MTSFFNDPFDLGFLLLVLLMLEVFSRRWVFFFWGGGVILTPFRTLTMPPPVNSSKSPFLRFMLTLQSSKSLIVYLAFLSKVDNYGYNVIVDLFGFKCQSSLFTCLIWMGSKMYQALKKSILITKHVHIRLDIIIKSKFPIKLKALFKGQVKVRSYDVPGNGIPTASH